MLELISYLIIILGIVNLTRLTALVIGSDIYDLRRVKKTPLAKREARIAVIIPAHNEEVCLERTLLSVLRNSYLNKRVVIVDDGSTDNTLEIANNLKNKFIREDIIVVTQRNKGKATAINNALQNHVKGFGLVMVLDADSIISNNAIESMVRHFDDKRVVAAAANVKIIDSFNLVTIAQRLEYLVSHRIKRALTTYNVEYIIGGVGSTFRKSALMSVGLYDTDTFTEDIDLTMKIINRKGNRDNVIKFASDVIAYTEGVIKFKSLIRQRFRWKYGRFQTFYKNKKLFFNSGAKYSKKLTFAQLPFTMLSELLLLVDPLLILFVAYISWVHAGYVGLIGVYLSVTFFNLVTIIADDSEGFSNKKRVLLSVPFSYFLLGIMSLVDFIALIKSLRQFPQIFKKQIQETTWVHVERVG